MCIPRPEAAYTVSWKHPEKEVIGLNSRKEVQKFIGEMVL